MAWSWNCFFGENEFKLKLSWEATLQLLEQESPQLIFTPEGLSSVISNKLNKFREGKKQTMWKTSEVYENREGKGRVKQNFVAQRVETVQLLHPQLQKPDQRR